MWVVACFAVPPGRVRITAYATPGTLTMSDADVSHAVNKSLDSIWAELNKTSMTDGGFQFAIANNTKVHKCKETS